MATQDPDVPAAADRPYGDTYTTEVGEVLFSLQALLLRESQGGVVDVAFATAEPDLDLPRWALEDIDAVPATPAPASVAASVPAPPAGGLTILPEASPAPPPVQDGLGYGRTPEPAPVLFDPATGAPTRESLAREIERQGSRVSAALVALDITPIGEIRERHGDAVADAILRAIVEAVPFAMRAEDQVYRTGVDELTLCVPGANLSDAAAMSLRLQMAVKDVLVRRELPTVILSIRPYQQVAA
jgi:diguanylate cyclase (GGDEF)-like protein